MDALFREVGSAHAMRAGNALSKTLNPVPDASNGQQLRKIWTSCNYNDAKAVIRRQMQANSPPGGYDNDEVQGWVEIYYCYWQALGQLFGLEDQNSGKGKVGPHL